MYINHTHAVNRILLEAVHHFGRVDVEDVVDWRDAGGKVALRVWRLVGLDIRRPDNRQRIARAGEQSAVAWKAL